MNHYVFSYSESLVLSLCKEIEYIKSRSKNINQSLKNCQNKILTRRLISELNKLNKNRLKILNISENMLKRNKKELSIELLLEITKRSNYFQQI
tara:strand:+ start:160 stop:441 length:282 start_codon:yes stop_codon:yes gene_type:complete